jgi:hypothetical protein
VTESLNADKAGSFLLSLTIPDSDLEIVERNLKTLKRQPGEKLISVMNTLAASAERLYRDFDVVEKKVMVDRIMFNGLWCFTAGETRRELEEALRTCANKKKKPVWEEIYEGTLLSEERYGKPNIELIYASGNDRTV